MFKRMPVRLNLNNTEKFIAVHININIFNDTRFIEQIKNIFVSLYKNIKKLDLIDEFVKRFPLNFHHFFNSIC